jgi:zinc protease
MIGIDWRRVANRAAVIAACIVSSNGRAAAQAAPGPSTATIDTSSATPLPRDPHVIVGTLPNGLRYYIRKNAKPE